MRNPREAPIDPLHAALLFGLAVSAIMDAFTSRIPNAITFSLLLVGFIGQTMYGEGAWFATMGAGLAFLIHFGLWQLKLEGAGDAKLMIAVGAIVGWETMLEATIWRYIFLFPYAALTLTVKGKWPNFFAALRWTADKMRGHDVGERPEPTYMPFGPLIAVAVPMAVYTGWLDLG